jgi:hypothetical protein
VKLNMHESFDPAFRVVSTLRSFERLEDYRPMSVGINGDEPPVGHHEHADVTVTVPNGSMVQVCANEPGGFCGMAKLVVPNFPKPLTPDEVWQLAKSGQRGFAIVA